MTNSVYLKTLDLFTEGYKNIKGKGDNAGYQHILLFTQCFLLKQGYFKHLKDYFFKLLNAKSHDLNHTKFIICKCFQYVLSQKFCDLVKASRRQ